MADYRSILDRAINGLSNNTEEARRAIYEKARSALMRQLSSLEPALSPAEISKQRLQLEEAVRETENQFTGIGALEDAVADALVDEPIAPEPAPTQIEAAPVVEPVPAEPKPAPMPAPTPQPVVEPEPVPEPVLEAEPQPVHEPGPEPVQDVAPEPEQTPEPEPIAAPEPIPAPEPVTSPEPAPAQVLEPTPEPEIIEAPELPTVGEKSDMPKVEEIAAVAEETASNRLEMPDTADKSQYVAPDPAPPIEEPDLVVPTVDDIVRSAEASADAMEPEPAFTPPPAPELPRASDLVVDVPSVETPSVQDPEPALPSAETPQATPEIKVGVPTVAAVATTAGAALATKTEPKIGFPEVDAPDVSVAPVAKEPVFDDPLEDLRSTMAEDGVDVAPTPEINFAEPDNIHDTFEDPSLANFEPEPVKIPPAKKSRGKGLIWILLLLIIGGAGVFAFVQREALMPVAGPVIEQVRGVLGLDTTDAPTQPTETPAATPTVGDDDKAEDRIPSRATDSDAGIKPGERVTLPDSTPATSEPVRDVTSEQPAVSDAPAETPAETPNETPAEQPKPADEPVFTPPSAVEETAATEEKPAETPTASSLFSANAILYEESPGGNQPNISTGNVIWELVEGGGNAFGASNLPSVRGNLRIQGRDLDVRFEVIRNLDDSLPASHVIELEFKPGPLFQTEVVNNIAGVVTKKNEQDNGKLLAGAVVKVSDTLFWVAMSARAADLASNTDALLKNGWFDIPIVFKSGKRAILTLEKGAAGQKALDTAFKTWAQ